MYFPVYTAKSPILFRHGYLNNRKWKSLSHVQLFATPWKLSGKHGSVQGWHAKLWSVPYLGGLPLWLTSMGSHRVGHDWSDLAAAAAAAACGSAGKESARNVGDLGSISGLGRSPGEGKTIEIHRKDIEKNKMTKKSLTVLLIMLINKCQLVVWVSLTDLRKDINWSRYTTHHPRTIFKNTEPFSW